MKRVFRLPGRSDKDVEREIELHIELRAREFERQGMNPDDARQAAIDAFGDRAQIENEVRDIHELTVAERQRRDWWEEVRQDVVVGARMLRRSPSFALVALLTLAIGIGANTAIFGVLRSVLLRPLPYAHPEQLVQVWSDHRALGRKAPEWLTPPDFIDWRDGNTTFTSMAAYQGWGPDLTGNGEAESLTGMLVSGNYFDVLGARPAAGRLVAMSDDDASAERVVVLSHAFWVRRFGAARSVIGSTVTLNGVPWKVAGVLPESFRAPIQASPPEVFAPLRRPSNSRCGRGCIVLRAIGRMKPGVTVAAAQADLARIAAREAQEYPETNAKVGAWLVPLHEQLTGPTRAGLVTLSVAVALVLLIGCFNLANLLLVRGSTRAREIGVRTALGAGRARMIRQLLTENALLASIGGLVGVGIGVGGTRALGSLVPAAVREVQQIRFDPQILMFAAGITIVAAVVFGLVPALHAVRPGLMSTLRGSAGQSGAGRRTHLLRDGLVVTQLSLAVVLLVGAGLLFRSFLSMQRVDLGYRSSGLYLTGLQFPAARYPGGARALLAINDVVARLRANPAIRTAEFTDLPPLSGGDQDITAIPVGSTPVAGQPPAIWYRSVSVEYLHAMGMKIVAGRGFTAEDRSNTPLVGIVNQQAANRFWPGENPIGRVLASGPEPDANKVTIVGIVASAHHDGPTQPYKAELFLPIEQMPSRGVALVLEPARDIASLTTALRQAVRDVDPLVPISSIDPIEQMVGDAVALPRLYSRLVGLFAAVALLLAALGVYGVMAYAVVQRQREIGVRLALGAAPSRIGRMVLGEGARLAVVGLGIGLAGALLLGQLLGKLLFGVTAHDALTLATVPPLLAIIMILASWIPARRAMRMDPLVAIREE